MKILWRSLFKFRKLLVSKAYFFLKKAIMFTALINVEVTQDTFSLMICKKNWGMQTSFLIIFSFSPSWKWCCIHSFASTGAGWGPYPGCPRWQVILQRVLLIQKFPCYCMLWSIQHFGLDSPEILFKLAVLGSWGRDLQRTLHAIHLKQCYHVVVFSTDYEGSQVD